MVRSLAIVLSLLLNFSTSATQIQQGNSQAGSGQYATRDGQRIVLHPSGISFLIPETWIDWFNEFHNNLHLTQEELAKVKDAQGQWDREYAQVVNSALPFNDCVAHVGGEGWGREGVSFKILQLRAYLTDLSPQEIRKKIEGDALQVARKVSSSDHPPKIESRSGAPWQEIVVRYRLFYGDYGGDAEVRFFIQPGKGKTFVMVFMSGKEEQVQAILKSVSAKTNEVNSSE